MRKDDFIRTYARFLKEGTGGLFIGAGLSMQAGYPSWQQLVTDMAREIDLDVTVEQDLPEVVQFFLNNAGRTRTRLARAIVEHFGEEKAIPEVFRLLARLPLRHVWTSNYDTLAERAWRDARKKIDAKSIDKDVVHEDPWAHAILYKMHGSVEHPAEVVIARGDYEEYRRKRGGFLHVLTGHLASRHFLFLGLSFTDPNLAQLFTIMRDTFEDTPTEHYAILRKPKRGGFATDALFTYATRRHAHWVKDLQNYGIQCVEIDEYEEIDDLLRSVERRLAMERIMVSGSYPNSHDPADAAERAKIEAIARDVGAMIGKRNFRFVSGYGLVVGGAALSGAVDEYNRQDTPNFERNLIIRPFPQVVPAGWDAQEYYDRYRSDLVMQAGACIFIAGIRQEPGGGRIPAPGVLREFDIAVAARRTPIPIGATGGMAAELWNRVNTDYAKFYGAMPRADFDMLNNAGASSDEIVSAVEKVLDWVIKNEPAA